MLMEKLREATKKEHDWMEEVSYSKAIMDGSLSKSEYFDLLLKQYFTHERLEEAMAEILPHEWKIALDYSSRKKLPFLEKDLHQNGLRPEQLEIVEIPAFSLKTRAGALGAMYVLEGATLGGAIILKKLRKNTNLQHIAAFHYYGCYGPAIGTMWKNFAFFVDTTLNHSNEHLQAIDAAKATFQFMGKVMENSAYVSITKKW